MPIVELAKFIGITGELTEVSEDNGIYACYNGQILFGWNYLLNSFLCIDLKEEHSLVIKWQVGLFDKLNKWMFDYRGLIDSGLAISTDEVNPYK